MKAMIFAAGLGTRLHPLTQTMPKALVEVAGTPMLERVVLRLKEAGFNDITINVHHFARQIVDFLGAHQNFGVNIHISNECQELLDTGGGIKQARQWLDGNEPFLVHNVDILSDLDLARFYHHHLQGNALATLLVSERQTARYLLFDNDRRLRGWINKSTQEVKPEGFAYCEGRYKEWAFGGIHVISPALFHYMNHERWTGKFSIIPFYLSVCQDTEIEGYPLQSARWFDIGKRETLAQAEAYYAKEATTE